MAGATLCLKCSQLPTKERGAATRIQRCAECNAEFGITAYGAAFRMPTTKRGPLSPLFFKGMSVGAGLFMLIVAVIGISVWISDSTTKPNPRAARPVPTDLTRVREVALHEPFPQNINPVDGKQRLAALVAMIKQESVNKQDGFMHKRIKERKELNGLPFVMGDACRMQQGSATSFQNSVLAVRDGLEAASGHGRFRHRHGGDQNHNSFWNTYLAQTGQQGTTTDHGIAALTQMLGPERMSLRHGLVQKMATTNNPQATKVIAKAAIFDPEGEVRLAALNALKDRPREEYSEVLMHGMRYPMAAVADRAGQAMIMLARKDMVPQLVAFLAEAVPGDPEEAIVDKEKVCVVREVVRINHHRNCLLCHAPTNTGGQQEVPGVLPIPGSPFPESPRDAYGNAQSTGDPMVRADTTYLRQDFSVLMPVANAAPWPEMQRFDFLVRNRVVDGDELLALQQKVRERGANFLSEHHETAVRVLRELTGLDVAPNQKAWQQALNK